MYFGLAREHPSVADKSHVRMRRQESFNRNYVDLFLKSDEYVGDDLSSAH